MTSCDLCYRKRPCDLAAKTDVQSGSRAYIFYHVSGTIWNRPGPPALHAHAECTRGVDRELSHRVHQLSAREELMLTASKLASVPVEEVSEFGKVFPEPGRTSGGGLRGGRRGGVC